MELYFADYFNLADGKAFFENSFAFVLASEWLGGKRMKLELGRIAGQSQALYLVYIP